MGAVIGIVAIIIYYVIISRYVSGDQASVGLLAITYLFVPLLGIPFFVASARSRFPAASKRATAKLVSTVAATVGLTIWGLVLYSRFELGSPAVPQLADTKAREVAWVERGKNAARSKLKDPDSAQFQKVYFYEGKDGVPITCGQVNSKNSFGGYGGFQRFVSAGSAELTFLEEQMASSEFTKVWNQMCSG